MTKAEPIGAHWERAREILYLPPSDEQTAIAQLLAERDSARAELVAEVERRRVTEALAERMWPIVREVAEADILNSDWPGHTRCGIPITVDLIRAAAALVREREEKETKP